MGNESAFDDPLSHRRAFAHQNVIIRQIPELAATVNKCEIECSGFIYCLLMSLWVQALLSARQEREIQLKMLLTRGEAVQRNTSAEGVPVIRKQIQDLKDSWDSLLSASIQCKRFDHVN